MRIVAINYHDNDFYSTIYPLLETIRSANAYWSGDISEEFVRQIIYKGVGFHYLTFQGKGKPDGSVVDYLHRKMEIFFDGDAEKKIEEGWGNSEALYLDCETGAITYF